MKKINLLSILVLMGFITLGIFILKDHTQDLAKILEIKFEYVLIIFLLIILSSLLRGHKSKILMDFYGINLKFKEWWGLQIMAQFWNYLAPFDAAGISARAIYFKKRYKFPYTLSISTVGISYLIDFLIFGLFGVIASFYLPLQDEIKYSLMIVFLIVSLFSIALLFFMPPLPINSDIKIVRYIIKSINGFQHARTDYALILKLSLNCVGRTLTSIIQLYIFFLAFDYKVSLYASSVIVIFTALATVISITPMNLGFKESVVVIIAKLFGVGTVLGAIVAVVDRVMTMLWVFISAPIFSYILFKDFKIKNSRIKRFI